MEFYLATHGGLIADHDWRQEGESFLDPVPCGKYRGFTIAKWLTEMAREY